VPLAQNVDNKKVWSHWSTRYRMCCVVCVCRWGCKCSCNTVSTEMWSVYLVLLTSEARQESDALQYLVQWLLLAGRLTRWPWPFDLFSPQLGGDMDSLYGQFWRRCRSQART